MDVRSLDKNVFAIGLKRGLNLPPKEVVNVIENRRPFSNYFSKIIVLDKKPKLRHIAQNIIFDLKLNNKVYVIKKIEHNSQVYLNLKADTSKKQILSFLKASGVDPRNFQKEYPRKAKFKKFSRLAIPTFSKDSCLKNKETNLSFVSKTDFYDRSNERVPENSYICDNMASVEYILGSLVSELFSQGVCINFTELYDMVILDFKGSKDPPYQYIIQEKLVCPLFELPWVGGEDVKAPYDEECINKIFSNLIIQTLFAVCAYQEIYKIVHCDLHDGNIMIKYILPEDTFRGQKILSKKFIKYRVGEVEIYLSLTPLLVKIIDFEFGIKFSEPYVLSSVENNQTPWEYIPSLDIIKMLKSFKLKMKDNLRDKILKVICQGCEPAQHYIKTYDDYLQYESFFKGWSARKILTDKTIMGEFYIKPEGCTEANTIIFGEIE